MFLWWPGKNCYSLAWKFWLVCHIQQMLVLRVSIYFVFYKILLMERILIPRKTVKVHEIIFAQYKVLGRWNYKVSWKMAEASGIQLWIRSTKFLVKMKNVSFIFTKKPKELFGQPNTKALLSLNVRFWLTLKLLSACLIGDSGSVFFSFVFLD